MKKMTIISINTEKIGKNFKNMLDITGMVCYYLTIPKKHKQILKTKETAEESDEKGFGKTNQM